MWVDLRYGEADGLRRVCGDGGCGAGQAGPSCGRWRRTWAA